jgi:FdhE protein
VTAIERLRNLADTDPAVAPMAMLQVEALVAATDPTWEHGVPQFERHRLAEGVPLLHGVDITVDGEHAVALVRRLAAAAAEHAGIRVEHALGSEPDAIELIATSITRDTDRLGQLADALAIEMSLLATLGSIAAVPVLQACRRRGSSLVADSGWDEAYCPICGGWPTLAEMRGLERQRWLRCGRCGAGWLFAGMVCVFCGCADHKDLGYLAPEGERDSRRAETCECCHSYLKTMATLGALQPEEVLLQDINSVELDIAAIQQGYGRPERQGFALELRLAARRGSQGPDPHPVSSRG